MSTVMSSWRERRLVARNRRAFHRLIDSASTPAMRNELITLAGGSAFNR